MSDGVQAERRMPAIDDEQCFYNRGTNLNSPIWIYNDFVWTHQS